MLSHFKTKQFVSCESELLPRLNLKIPPALCVWHWGWRIYSIKDLTILCRFYVRDLTFPGFLP